MLVEKFPQTKRKATEVLKPPEDKIAILGKCDGIPLSKCDRIPLAKCDGIPLSKCDPVELYLLMLSRLIIFITDIYFISHLELHSIPDIIFVTFRVDGDI